MEAEPTRAATTHDTGGVQVTAFHGGDESPCGGRVWVSLASVQPPLQLVGSNSARTVRRLLALPVADVAAVESDHYLVGSAAKEILSAAADDLEFSSDSGRERVRMISPQLLSLLLLAWSELPVDHPGQRLWRPSGAAPFTTMEEFDARAAHIAAFMASKVSLMLRHAYKL